MVSMSSAPSAVKNEKPAPISHKKRTADQAGLDHAMTEALSKKKDGDMQASESQSATKASDPAGQDAPSEVKDISGKDWLLEQVAKMESAFKDACYYRALIIRFHVEARYHNLHYIQPQAPRYMLDKYRRACMTWEDTKFQVQIYLEEAAKHYVPPAAPIENEVMPSLPDAATPTAAQSSHGNSRPQSSTTRVDAALPYIDPRTGLPSPTQPTIRIDDVLVGSATKQNVPKGSQNGKTSATTKKSPAPRGPGHDSGRKKTVSTPIPTDPGNSAMSSINSKFPTGSAGDPIEIDDLDIDMDNDADIVPLTGTPMLNGKPAGSSFKQDTQRGMSAGALPVTQPEGIGLGLGIGEINVDLPATLSSVPQASTNSVVDATTGDVNAGSFGDVSAALYNIQNAVADPAFNMGSGGETQLSEEDIMTFFQSLAPDGGEGDNAGQGGIGSNPLAGDTGQFAGNGDFGGIGQFAGNNQDQSAFAVTAGSNSIDQLTNLVGDISNALDQPFEDGINADTTNVPKDAAQYGNFDTEAGEAKAVPQGEGGGDLGMPEELDLSNMDWTQYSALLADIPDDAGEGA